MKARTVKIHKTIEVDVEVTCSVTPGAPPTGPSYSSGGEPGYGPEVEILSIESDKGAALHIIDELSREDVAAITDAAIEAASEEEVELEADRAEHMSDCRREREYEERHGG